MLRPIPRQSAKVRGESKVRFGKDYHKAAVEFSPKDYNSDRYWFGIEFDVDQTGQCLSDFDSHKSFFPLYQKYVRRLIRCSKYGPFGIFDLK